MPSPRATSRSTRRALRACTLAAAAALTGCGGGSSAPPPSPAEQARAAVQRYVDALEARDAHAACAATSVESQQRTGGTGTACENSVEAALNAGPNQFKGAKATKVRLNGDHAIVQVDLAGGAVTHLAAVREKGRWFYEATAL